jgi:hypothetical protein
MSVHPHKIVEELKGKPANHDIISMIRERHDKKIKPEKFEYLNPTIANLFGLQVRFRFTDEQVQAELERKYFPPI